MAATRFDLTTLPDHIPTSLYRYRDGLYAVDLLAAALVEFGFFTWLAAQPAATASTAEIQAHFGFHARPLDVMLTLFRCQGYIQTQGERHTATRYATEHLLVESPWNLAPYFASLHSRPIARDYIQVLKSGKPAGWSGDQASNDWHVAMEDESFARKFTAAMDCRGRLLAAALTQACPVPPQARLLDIGGGSGIYACAFAARYADLRATVLEQEPVDRICRTLIAERGYADQVDVAVGSMFHALPEGYNVHLFSNVLHDWDLPEVRQLLAKSHQHLPPGGLVFIHDAFIADAKDGPEHVAEYSALLMHSTQGKCYSAAEYADLLTEAGFQPGPYQDTLVGRGFMTALRR
jgi:predicted O-methyltransferase YrrM